MVNVSKICAYIQEELARNVHKKLELEILKEKHRKETENQKEQLEECRNKTAQKLKIIKIKQQTPGISAATIGRLDEMYGEIAEYIDEIDDKINELYDILDEQVEKIDEQIYEIDEKINELNELIDENDNQDDQEDEDLIRELEDEIKRIDMNNMKTELKETEDDALFLSNYEKNQKNAI